MNSLNTYLKILLLTAGCLFTGSLYAQDEEPATDEGMAGQEGMAADEGAAADEGMLEEEGKKLPPLYTSKIEVGIGTSSVDNFENRADSFKFGEYNGLQDEGAYFIGNISYKKLSLLGDNDPNYWEFSGTNLGLDNRNVYMEYNHDGTYGDYSRNSDYKVFFEYDQIPHNQFRDGQTPFNGAGTSDQTLPANWVGASSTSGLTQLIPDLKSVELETERKRYGGGLKWHLTDHWLAQANYRHETKDGADPIGAVFGSNGGNPRSSVLAVPINYDVDEFDTSIAYTGDKGQYSLNYHLSVFNNNDNSVLWDNPFNNSSWPAGSNFSDGARGQLGLFPDNMAHQVNFSGGYNFTPKTRALATISYSRWLQDQNFLPYSNVFPAATPLPRNSLDGDIEKLFANFSIFSRITNKLDVTARYTYDDRNNNTPQDVYLRMQGDAVSTAQQPDITSESARVNWNYDMTRHKFELNGGYRLFPMTKLEAGYAFERNERNLTEVATTDEHSGHIKLMASPFDSTTGWVKYQHSVLEGSDYVSNEPFLASHTKEAIDEIITNDCGGTVVGCSELFENDFLVRKYIFANRDRDQFQGALNFSANEKLDFSVNGEFRLDDYPDTELGLHKSRNYNVTFDVNYHPSDRFNIYAFATHEIYQYDQRGFRRDGDVFGPGDDRFAETDEDFWTTNTEDRINMIGTGFVWDVIEDKFNVNLDFTYSRGNTSFDQWSGPALTGGNIAVPLPDVTTRITDLSLTGEYKFKQNMSVRLKYMYEKFVTHDFGLDGVAVDTLSNVILLGNQSPNYTAHVFGLSFVYDF